MPVDETIAPNQAGHRPDTDQLAMKANNFVDVRAEFGAALDEVTDDTSAIQAAIDYVVDTLDGSGVIWISRSCRITEGLVSYKGICLSGPRGVTIQCDEIETPGAALTIAAGGVVNGLPIVDGIKFRGHADTEPNGIDEDINFTAGLTGLHVEANQVSFRSMTLEGFDRATKFGDHTYILDFWDCTSRSNNYGFHYDGDGITDSGERIAWHGGVIANNNYGIYNNFGDLLFDGVSIDYNVVNQVAENITDISATASGILIFRDCHIERSNSGQVDPEPAFINSGKMLISGGSIWDHNGKTVFQNNTGCVTRTTDVLYRFHASDYMCTGAGAFFARDSIPVSTFQCIRFNAQHSRVTNGGFESGDMTAWDVVGGPANVPPGQAEAVGASYAGSWAMRMKAAGAFNSTIVTSAKAPIEVGKTFCLLSYYKVNSSGGPVYVHLVYSDGDGNPLFDDALTQDNDGDTDWVLAEYQGAIPQGAAFVAVQFITDLACTDWAFYDEVCLNFY